MKAVFDIRFLLLRQQFKSLTETEFLDSVDKVSGIAISVFRKPPDAYSA
jgi:hypothetical protein